MQHVLEYEVLSVSPASIPKQKSYAMRQIASARHGTSAFMQAFIVVVHLKIGTHKNKIFDVFFFVCFVLFCFKSVILDGYTFTHKTWSFDSFLLDKKKEALQQSNTHIVTNAVKRT